MTRLQQSRRNSIGFVYKTQNNNNIVLIQPSRNLLAVQQQDFQPPESHNEMAGGTKGVGFMEDVKNIINKGKKALKDNLPTAVEIYSGEIGTAIRNAIPDSDNTARPGYAGETHMILKLPNGRSGVGNFIGPGTQVIERVKRGDPGRTPTDWVAKRHDIDYTLAGNARTTGEQMKLVRRADNRMITSLQRIKANRLDSGRNITAGLRLIQAKTIAEDLGVLKKDVFAGSLDKLSTQDSALLNSAKNKLEQKGFGKLPGTRLKMKMMRKSRGSVNRDLGKSFKLNPKPLIGGGKDETAFAAKASIGLITEGFKLVPGGDKVNKALKPTFKRALKDLEAWRQGKRPIDLMTKAERAKALKKLVQMKSAPRKTDKRKKAVALWKQMRAPLSQKRLNPTNRKILRDGGFKVKGNKVTPPR